MAKLTEIVTYCNDLLQITKYSDYCPNGLQIEGPITVNRLVTGVTSSQALIDRAIEEKADALLVHHGIFWKGEDQRLIGMKFKRIKALIANRISLLAYHLPLDAHLTLGNNAQLAKQLLLHNFTVVNEGPGEGLLFYCDLDKSVSVLEIAKRIELALGRKPLHIDGGSRQVQRIGWCTGGAQSFIDQAAEWDLDVYISGEISEQTTHCAIENRLHYFAAGHHATERYGVKALGEHLGSEFGIEHINVDINNPA